MSGTYPGKRTKRALILASLVGTGFLAFLVFRYNDLRALRHEHRRSCAVAGALAVVVANPMEVRLPAALIAIPGNEARVFFDDVVNPADLKGLRVIVACPHGHCGPHGWTFTPGEQDAGTYPFTVTVTDHDGAVLARVRSTLTVKPLSFFLPPSIYAVPGVEARVFFDNLVDAADANRLRFTVACPRGSCGRRCWTFTPAERDAGTYPFAVTVTDAKGTVLARGNSTLKVAPARASEGRPLRLLIVGDSVTAAGIYPTRLKQLLAQPGNPTVTFLGTCTEDSCPAGVVFTAYSGWTWQAYLTQGKPGAVVYPYCATSPFLYKAGSGQLELDVARYLRERCHNVRPDLVIFELGINDCFRFEVSTIPADAKTLVAAFRKALPKADLAIWLTQPVNYSQETFNAVYQGYHQQARIKTKQHQLAQELARVFGSRESQGLYLLPMNLSVDPIDDYPVTEAVHPSPSGYARIGEATYAWIKWWLAAHEADSGEAGRFMTSMSGP